MSTEEKHLESLLALSQLTVDQCRKRLKEIRQTEQKPERKGKRGLSEADRARLRAKTAKTLTPRS